MPENASGEADSGNAPQFKNVPDATYEWFYVSCNLSEREIAEQFDTTRHKIRTQLISRGILRENQIQETEEKLKKLYHGDGLSQSEVADKIGMSETALNRHIKHYDLGKEPKQWQRDRYGNAVSFRTNTRGYEVFSIPGGGEFPVHRLVAVAEYGFDAVAGNDVHHVNGIKWDNRPENLEAMSSELHATLHNTDSNTLDGVIESATESELRTALRNNGYTDAADDI